ncbi:cation:dicarboxylate symporter family transporter, partial [Streptomyces kanamyceticus]
AVVFKILHYVMLAAPVGAFGAMAFTIGNYGISTLTSLGRLIGLFYGTSAFFVIVVLGAVTAALRINIFRLLRYLREEFVLVLGTSSSESALPRLMTKLEGLGIRRDIVGLTVPTGYSFNLDGSSIYLSLAAVYIAQATDTPLGIGQQLGLLAVMILTSKGSGGITGAGFIALAATLSTVGTVPAAGIMLIFGIDKFMSECRALTNLAGNSVATLVVARWEKALDIAYVNGVLHTGKPRPRAEQKRESPPVPELRDV